MGREVKRVDVGFKWPIGQIWKGYWHPFHAMECRACGGSGENPEYKKLSDDWYGFERPGNRWCYSITQDEVQALVDEGRLWDFTRVPLNDKQKQDVDKKIAEGGNSWLPYDNGRIPTAEEVNTWASGPGFGHDSINKWICVRTRAKRLGISDAPCEYCKGEGSFYPTDEIKKMSDEWEGFDPPAGKGYQLWETTSEGSPISPVFETPEELAKWLYENNASSFGSDTCSYEQWLKFIQGPGWAPSAIYKPGEGLKSGVDAA